MTKLFIDDPLLLEAKNDLVSSKSILSGINGPLNPPCSFSGQEVLNKIPIAVSNTKSDCTKIINWIEKSIKIYTNYESQTESDASKIECADVLLETQEIANLY